MNVIAHKSLSESYIQDYIRLTHEIYPSFITKLSTIYYSLNIEASNINDNFQTFYKNISNSEHGRKYDAIYNVPVHIATNTAITRNAGEKGITTIESANINCNIDAFINITPKEGDVITFINNLNNQAVYQVINIETSSTLRKPYSKLHLQLVANLTQKKMQKFIISEKAFITNYHYIFGKEEALLIIELQKRIDEFIEYFNDIYDHKVDAHVDNDHRVFLEFEKAFNDMLDTYTQHTQFLKINRSHLHENLLIYYSDDNPFRRLLDPFANRSDIKTKEFSYTASIKRLDKTRRRTINNKIKIYRLLSNSKSDQLLAANYSSNVHNLSFADNNSIDDWDLLINNDDFINDVKDVLSTFIKNECKVIPNNMIKNAIRLAQIFYIMECKIGTAIKTRFTNISHPFTSVTN